MAELLNDSELSKVSKATLFLDEQGHASKLTVWQDPNEQAAELFKSIQTELVTALTLP